jgi:hypothetical protein
MEIDKDQLLGQIINFIVGLLQSKTISAKVTIPLGTESQPAKQDSPPVYKITKDELLKGRDKQYATEYSQQISDNLDKLLVPINKLRDAWGKPMIVTSGWRPPEINDSTPGAAAKSKHMYGLAVDIQDSDGSLMKWTLENLELMKELGLYMEDFRWTYNWCHYQLGAPGSGKRIFVPSSARPSSPDKWDGKYDSQYDSNS